MTAILADVKVHPSRVTLPPGSEAFRARVDQELRRVLADARARIEASAPESLLLLDELTDVIEAGGKRLRPLFCYWAYRAGGGPDGSAIARAAGAIEMLHTAAIVHDDLLDRSHLRRGRPASYRALSGTDGGADRLGRAAAVLAGDLAQALAERMLVGSGFPAEVIVAASDPFTAMRIEAVSGEMLDLLAAGDPGRSAVPAGGGSEEALARRVGALKSGSYSVAGPIRVGAALAVAGGAVRRALDAFGQPLGEAFQLRDDVLGTFGDPEVTGKDRDTDLLEGKLTVLVAKARALAGSGRVGIDRGPAARGRVGEIRDAIRSSGALSETIELIGSLLLEAKAALASAPIPPEARRALEGLADLVALRHE